LDAFWRVIGRTRWTGNFLSAARRESARTQLKTLFYIEAPLERDFYSIGMGAGDGTSGSFMLQREGNNACF
jgi:hypothetical protein